MHIEIEEFSDVRFKRHAVYVDQCVDVSTVGRWERRIKDGELGQAELSDKSQRTDFKKLLQRWRKYIEVRGDFVQKIITQL